MAGSGRARGRSGGGTAPAASKKAPAAKADAHSPTLTEVLLSRMCAPARSHLSGHPDPHAPARR